MAHARIKRPAYQWYPADAATDEVFKLMTYEQQGIYHRLLDHQWNEGSIPADEALIAALLPKITHDRFLELWLLISGKFRPTGVRRLINDRLEQQRRDLDKYIRTQKRNAARRRPRRTSAASHGSAMDPANTQPRVESSTSSSTSSSTTSKELPKNSVCAVTSTAPAVLDFPTVGPVATWGLTEGQIAKWQGMFPGLDVLGVCRRALAWCDANPQKRKTARGMPAFLVRWLGNETDRGHSAPVFRAGGSKTAGNDAALASFVAQHQGKPA